ncbi:MAG: ABC transporter ATP-binding protein/permease [Bacilli bacterium]|jgi:ATP-binding cassette subfamily B protein AbcA/BmrA|nr:ABC transporter ATP-binding protein/permease [Bacilli bacterium]
MSGLSQLFKPNKTATEVKELSVKGHIFSTLYKGVHIPWFSICLGAFFAVFNALVLLTQYDNYQAIFNGTMKDLTPLWMYLLASFVQYILIFAGVLCDLGFVTIVTGVRKKMWKKMMNLPLRDFDTSAPNGMLSRITSDAEYASKPFYAIIALLQIVTYIISISVAAPKELYQGLIIFGITFALALLAVFFSVKLCSKATTLVQNSISLETDYYTEQLANFKFIKASSAEEKAIKKSLELIDNRYQASLYNAFATAIQTLANNFTEIIIYCCVCLGGIWAIEVKSITDMQPINAIYVFGMALEMTLVAIMTLPSYFAAAFGGSKELVSVFRRQEENIVAGSALKEEKDELKANDVSFAYNEKSVVEHVDFKFPAGKVTAIIGSNGSGKSTLLKLVDRLYPPLNGGFQLGDIKDKDISLQSWREQFGIVSQNASLFSGSIKDNITYGLIKEPSDADLKRVVSLSCLDSVIASHEGGLAYDVGVKGSRLSGGEQERVAIARAMMKNPRFLLLDEATANLDTKTESEIEKGLMNLMKGRTVIMVAHHYSLVKKADCVIVMDHGKAVDYGSPEELLKRNPYYQALAKEK